MPTCRKSWQDWGFRNLALYMNEAVCREFRAGDVRYSQADISKAINELGYAPQCRIMEGIAKAMPWYVTKVG